MRAVHTYAGYLKELRSGAELADLDEDDHGTEDESHR